MEHFVELVKALAWPTAVVWLGYIFRGDLRKLLERISNLKYKDLEANFNESLRKAEKEAESVESPSSSVSEDDLSLKEQLLRISEVSPRAAVVESWTLIETAAMKNGLWSGSKIKRTNPRMILDFLKESGNFSPNSLDLIDQLRQIRNKASHLPDFAISQSEAERYMDLAIKSAAVIEAATN